MLYVFGIALGIATYQWLFKILGIDEGVAETTGWVVGIGIIFFAEWFESVIAKLKPSENKKILNLRIKNLEDEVEKFKQKEARENEKNNKMNFFKEKEM